MSRGKSWRFTLSEPPLSCFGIVNKIRIPFHFRIPQPGVEGVRPGIPGGSVQRKKPCIRKQCFDFPHHTSAVTFPKVLRINEYPSDIQRVPVPEKDRPADDQAILRQFEQMA